MKLLEYLKRGKRERRNLSAVSLPLITEQLYLYAGRSLLFLLTVVLLITVLLYGNTPTTRLFLWSGSLITLILYRFYELHRFREWMDRTGNLKEKASEWHRRFRDKAIITALLTGISVPLFLPHLSDGYLRFLLFFFIIGVSAGALAALFPDESLVTIYVTLTNLPFFLYLLLSHEPYSFIIAMVQALFVTVLLLIAQINRRFMFQVWEQKKELLAKERELHSLFEQTPTPIFYFDTQLRIRKYNQALQKFFNLPPEIQLENFDLHKLRHYPALQKMEELIETRQPTEYNGYYLSTFQPEEFWVMAKMAPLFNEEGELIGGIVSFQDKTVEKKSIEHLEKLASQDILTNLGNRRSFFQALNQLVSSSDSDSRLSLLLFIDLDQFKPINDTLGHHTGDRVLREVAKILRELTPENARAFRHGGDEFVILFTHCCTEESEAKKQGEEFVTRLNTLLQTRIVIDGYHLPLHSSVGIVIVTPEMRNSDEIIRRADVSMYQAKGSREHCAFYDPTMDYARQKSFHLRQSLGRTEIEEQLRLEFQPIVSLNDGTVIGAEALIRWEHPTLGLLYPKDFIATAVECGEIGRIGRWVSRRVCETLREIRDRYPESSLKYLSFNIDARELNYDQFPEHLESLIRQYDIRPEELTLEITENSLIDNFSQIQKTLTRFHQLGIRWAIDDFGIGYSSLSYLERLSFDILKIDRSFTASLEKSDDAFFLIEHILEIARHLGYRVTVEGIETAEQADRLRQIDSVLQCQGYYYSHPLKAKDFFQLLQNPGTLRHSIPD